MENDYQRSTILPVKSSFAFLKFFILIVKTIPHLPEIEIQFIEYILYLNIHIK